MLAASRASCTCTPRTLWATSSERARRRIPIFGKGLRCVAEAHTLPSLFPNFKYSDFTGLGQKPLNIFKDLANPPEAERALCAARYRA